MYNILKIKRVQSITILIFCLLISFALYSCSTFSYKTYKEQPELDDPDPNFNVTLNEDFQNFTNFMFIGNRIENFVTYFNTYFNAKESYDNAYEDYSTRVLSLYSTRIDNIYGSVQLSQESIDNFNKAIQNASKVIQYRKSSQFMDKSVILIGKSYFYLGDYVKAERKFSEFISKLSLSPVLDEALLYLAKTQLRQNNITPALERLNKLISASKDRNVVAESYKTIGEYYIYKKDYPTAISNYKKSIEFSEDEEFSAQMQFLIAGITSRSDFKLASNEYLKVLNYGTTFDQEFFALYNQAKYLVLGNELSKSKPLIEKLEVKYKDIPEYLSQVMLLKAVYYDQKKDYKRAIEQYSYVIQNFGKTVASSDASYYLGKYFETVEKNYLRAFQFYSYANEENSAGTNASLNQAKLKTLRKYFDLRTMYTGQTVHTEYDESFYKIFDKNYIDQKGEENKEGELKGKDGGRPGYFQDSLITVDTVSFTDTLSSVDTMKAYYEKVSTSSYQLGELFSYELYNHDSAQYYFNSAFEIAQDYELKAKSLYALALLYKNTDKSALYEEKLNIILKDFANSSVANESRILLDIPVLENSADDEAVNIYNTSEQKFISGDYNSALSGFYTIINSFPGSKYFHKSLYSAGWIYENELRNADSSYSYYSKLLSLKPDQDYIKIILPKVEEYQRSKNIQSTDTSVTMDTSQIKDTSLIINEEVKENINKPPVEDNPDLNKQIDNDGQINPDLKKEDIPNEDGIQNDK